MALNNVSLEIPPGVVFALLGENGAGKTTAIRIALGLVAADGGSSQVLGLDSQTRGPADPPKRGLRRRAANALRLDDGRRDRLVRRWFLWRTVTGDNIANWSSSSSCPLTRRSSRSRKACVPKWRCRWPWPTIPQLLILDEPTSGLDPLVRREFLESMVDRAAAGKSVLLSSHQITEVERVADHVAILHEGKMRLVATLDELKTTIQELTVTLGEGDGPCPTCPARSCGNRQRRTSGNCWCETLPTPPTNCAAVGNRTSRNTNPHTRRDLCRLCRTRRQLRASRTRDR